MIDLYWNHRVLERVENDETTFNIVEVYYDSDDNGILGWTENESAWGESLESLHQTLVWMLEALEKPVLNEAELLRQADEHREAGTGPFADMEIVGSYDSVEELLAALDENETDDPGCDVCGMHDRSEPCGTSDEYVLPEEFHPYFESYPEWEDDGGANQG